MPLTIAGGVVQLVTKMILLSMVKWARLGRLHDPVFLIKGMQPTAGSGVEGEQQKGVKCRLGIPERFSNFSVADASKVVHAEPEDSTLWGVTSLVYLRNL